MGVYVKGMDMPKSCFECPFMLHRCFCLVNPRIEFTDEEYSELKGRYSGCPIVEVKAPHGDLVDRDDVKYWAERAENIDHLEGIINQFVPIIEAEGKDDG